MKKFKIFVTRRIPQNGLDLLTKRKNFEVEVYPKNKKISRWGLLQKVQGCDAILSLLTDTIDAKLLDAAGKNLKIVSNFAVGFDNVDLKAAKQRKIIVTNTPAPTISESVAEHALALIFGLAHRITEADRFTRTGKYKGWSPTLLTGTDVFGKTLGIVGLGRIGKALAQRMKDGFGVKILYHDVSRDEAFEMETGARFVPMKILLQKSDFVSLHVPLLKTTRHLIGAKELKLMKPTAFLVNTARGPVVDEIALTKALEKRQIGGAGLDVYECEPFIDCNPRDTHSLRKLDNVILTPHTASATKEAREAMADIAAKNIIAVLSGKPPVTPAG